MRGEEECQPLSDPSGGRCKCVVRVRGETGPKWGQDGKCVKYSATSEISRETFKRVYNSKMTRAGPSPKSKPKVK